MDFPIEICVSLKIFLLMLINTQAVFPDRVILSISTSAKINDSAQIFCNATSISNQAFAVFRHHNIGFNLIYPLDNGRHSPNMSVIGSPYEYYYQYTISSLSCSDRGSYSCTVLNNIGGIDSNIVTLDVFGPPGRPNLIVPFVIESFGQNVTIVCDSNVGKPAQDLHLCVGNSNNKNLLCATQNQPVEHVDKCIFRRNASITFQFSEETLIASCIVGSSALKSEQTWTIGSLSRGPRSQPNLFLAATICFVVSRSHIYGT